MCKTVLLLLTVNVILVSGQLRQKRGFGPPYPFGGGPGALPYGGGFNGAFSAPYAGFGLDISASKLNGARNGGFPAALPGVFEVPLIPPGFPIPYIYSSKYLQDTTPVSFSSGKTVVPFFDAVGLSIASIIENIIRNLYDQNEVYPYPVPNPVAFPISVKIPIAEAVDRPVPKSTFYGSVDHEHSNHEFPF